MQITCAQCFQELKQNPGEKVFRNDECPHCSAPLRTCKMCEHYNPQSYNECKEPVAERVIDKEKANFCNFFRINHTQSHQDSNANHLAAAAALFEK